MAKNKYPGLYWDKETGKGAVDKRIEGLGRVRHRFTAGTWHEAEAEYHHAIAVAKTQAVSPKLRTFREAATKYLNEETKSSLLRDGDCLANLDPWIGLFKLDQIHQGTLQPYIQHRRDQGIKSATVARELAVVRRILTLATRVWRDLDNQPWLTVAPLLRMPNWMDAAQPYPPSFDEQSRLINELPDHLADMALFAAHTGVREHVVAELRWSWEVKINELSSSVFLVPGAFTKNDTNCLIALNSVASRVVNSRRGKHDTHVFDFRGKPVARMHNSSLETSLEVRWTAGGAQVLSQSASYICSQAAFGWCAAGNP